MKKRITLGQIVVGLFTISAIVSCFASAGCSSDSGPPNDPAYYKGPMKPKNATPGGAQENN